MLEKYWNRKNLLWTIVNSIKLKIRTIIIDRIRITENMIIKEENLALIQSVLVKTTMIGINTISIILRKKHGTIHHQKLQKQLMMVQVIGLKKMDPRKIQTYSNFHQFYSQRHFSLKGHFSSHHVVIIVIILIIVIRDYRVIRVNQHEIHHLITVVVLAGIV